MTQHSTKRGYNHSYSLGRDFRETDKISVTDKGLQNLSRGGATKLGIRKYSTGPVTLWVSELGDLWVKVYKFNAFQHEITIEGLKHSVVLSIGDNLIALIYSSLKDNHLLVVRGEEVVNKTYRFSTLPENVFFPRHCTENYDEEITGRLIVTDLGIIAEVTTAKTGTKGILMRLENGEIYDLPEGLNTFELSTCTIVPYVRGVIEERGRVYRIIIDAPVTNGIFDNTFDNSFS